MTMVPHGLLQLRNEQPGGDEIMARTGGEGAGADQGGACLLTALGVICSEAGECPHQGCTDNKHKGGWNEERAKRQKMCSSDIRFAWLDIPGGKSVEYLLAVGSC
jgi:hypothetical protein